MSSSRRFRALAAASVSGLLLVSVSCGSSEADGTLERVDAREAVVLLQEEDLVPLDLRPRREFADIHVAGAESLPWRGADAFREQLRRLDPDQHYLVYAHRRDQSVAAAEVMLDEGFEHVTATGTLGMLVLADAPLAGSKAP